MDDLPTKRDIDRISEMLDYDLADAFNELYEDYVELHRELFNEVAGEPDEEGWCCSDARSTAVHAAERLVALGEYEKREGGVGRVQYYRPIPKKDQT